MQFENGGCEMADILSRERWVNVHVEPWHADNDLNIVDYYTENQESPRYHFGRME